MPVCPNCGGPRSTPLRLIRIGLPSGYRHTGTPYEVECADHFHDAPHRHSYEFVYTFGSDGPVAIVCTECDATWKVIPDSTETCPWCGSDNPHFYRDQHGSVRWSFGDTQRCGHSFHRVPARERWWVKRGTRHGLVGHVRDDGVVPPNGVGPDWIEVVPASERDVLALGYEGARKVPAIDAEKLAAAEGKLADMTADRDAWIERAIELSTKLAERDIEVKAVPLVRIDPDESLKKALVVIGDINHANRLSLADAEVVIHVPLVGGAYIWKHRAGFAGFELRTLVA